ASLSVTASQDLGGGASSGGLNAGQDFGEDFSVDTGAGTATLTILSSRSFPATSVTVTASISDIRGNASNAVSFAFTGGQATATRRPFDTTDRWLLNFVRDNYTVDSTISSGTVTLSIIAGANGTSDFVEDLRLLGLQSASPPAAAVSADTNGTVLSSVKLAILGYLNVYYGRNADGSASSGSANISFSQTVPASPYSAIGIGGDDPVPGYTIGRAEYDYRNALSNDDDDSDLGVFTTNLIDFYINSSFTFKSRFDPLISGRGTVVGHHADDVTVLSPGFDRSAGGNTAAQNSRYDQIATAIDSIARAVATILAHEIGHSVGLVANGAPTGGLFGGEYLASFAGAYTNTYHLDTSANDIMAASLSFTGMISTGASAPSFPELILAYLLEQVLLD
ncbi:MAG: hypothetical protein FD127_4244, partial [Acidimicrobiaceae bacterium]